MPDRTASLTAPTGRSASHERGTELLRSLAPALTDWLPRQRWFAGRGRRPGALTLVAATELLPLPDTRGDRGAAGPASTPGLLHLLVRAAPPADHRGEDDAADCYQLLLGVRQVLPPDFANARIGSPAAGPLCGLTVYEALHDPRLAAVLLERLRVPGRFGPLRFAHGPGAAAPAGLPGRPLDTDQSNSSVVFGTSHILKLFRRVGPGVNPDLELPLALSRQGCDRVPVPTAWFETADPEGRGASLTLGVLQPYLADGDDGWQFALRTLADRADFTGPAHRLGGTTAQVHAGLAEAFPATVLDGDRLRRTAAAMTARLEDAARAVPALRPHRDGVQAAFTALAGLADAGQYRSAQRIHGDLHLGQTLHTPDGRWTLIDFEGEPARPLAERRTPQPAVRDVAGMLRSFDYAAACRPTDTRPGAQHDSWAQEWATAARAAYCAGYAAITGTDPREDAVLLRAFETDKAVYEVLYEARHRPEWLPVPLAAIRRLAAAPSAP
ncbi:maltokinase N-terminal cap-like domain-containing protein [Streptomyces sp. TR02-1]|uniref:maltokinase N-terminal cap-like domain-containing protein n=1 Tax=Streptomyces sp. TR02-1 TaxID=3385977 RepID=UPI00399FE554